MLKKHIELILQTGAIVLPLTIFFKSFWYIVNSLISFSLIVCLDWSRQGIRTAGNYDPAVGGKREGFAGGRTGS